MCTALSAVPTTVYLAEVPSRRHPVHPPSIYHSALPNAEVRHALIKLFVDSGNLVIFTNTVCARSSVVFFGWIEPAPYRPPNRTVSEHFVLHFM